MVKSTSTGHVEVDDGQRMSWSLALPPLCLALWFIQIRILYWIIIIKILMIKVGLWFIYAMQWILIPHRSSSGPGGDTRTPHDATKAAIYCPCAVSFLNVQSPFLSPLVISLARKGRRTIQTRERRNGGIKPRWRILIWYRVVTTVSN